MAVEVKVDGLNDLVQKLRELAPAMRKRVLRNALSAGARVVRDEAKRNVPVLNASMKAPYRKPGTVRAAIRVRASKVTRRSGDIGVFVNVKPAKSTARGAKSHTDPFYWRFLEFGTRNMSARSFLRPAAAKLSDALAIFQTQVGRWIEKVNASGKVTP